MNNKVIYIAGPITGVADYKDAFNVTENYLKSKGFTVLNPASLPSTLTNEQAMVIDIGMINVADAVFFLPNWNESRGAFLEWQYCLYIKKPHFEDMSELLEAMQ